MKVSVQENYVIILEEVFNPILLKSSADDVISICMRDSGFEFNYHGTLYEAKEGVVKPLTKNSF